MTTHTFTLDPFQKEAIEALKNGVSVVVSAPTGSGKTAIAEFVIEEALKGNERVLQNVPEEIAVKELVKIINSVKTT